MTAAQAMIWPGLELPDTMAAPPPTEPDDGYEPPLPLRAPQLRLWGLCRRHGVVVTVRDRLGFRVCGRCQR